MKEKKDKELMEKFRIQKENMKNRYSILKAFLTYAVSLIVAMLLLAVFMRLDLFSNIVIYYYRTMLNGVVVTIIVTLLLILISKNAKIKNLEFIDLSPQTIASATLSVGLALILFITIAPMVIDRSYTVFTLADMTENDTKTFTAQEIENRFIDIYIKGYSSTLKRIKEQLSIGNIEEKEDGYIITEKGKRLVSTFRFVESIYPVEDKRIIYPDGN